MRNILISVAVLVVVSVLGWLALDNISFSVAIGIILSLVTFFVLTRRIMKELEIINQKAQKAMGARNFDRAIRVYEGALSLSKKSPFVKGQLYGSIGMLYYVQKKNEEAKPYLEKSSAMNWVAKGMLAICYYREKTYDKMIKVMEESSVSNKKEGLVWGLYAYLLDKIGKREDAIKVLEKAQKKMKSEDERITKNLLELKNNRKMRMKLFGDHWYQFMLENPPRRMVEQQAPSYMKYKKNAHYRGR